MPIQTPYGEWHDDSEFHYERHGLEVHIHTTSLTNHELREIMIGMWSRLDPADKLDHILELHAYQNPNEKISGLAQQIKDA